MPTCIVTLFTIINLIKHLAKIITVAKYNQKASVT